MGNPNNINRESDGNDTVSLWDVLLILVRNGRVIVKAVVVSLILGLLLALFSPSKYQATVRLVPEANSDASGGIGGLAALRGFGINLGTQSEGLTTKTYPDIILSRTVRFAVVRQQFYSD